MATGRPGRMRLRGRGCPDCNNQHCQFSEYFVCSKSPMKVEADDMQTVANHIRRFQA
jgi:hypothetical protein